MFYEMMELYYNVRSEKVIYPFVPTFIDRNTEFEKTVVMRRVHTPYSEIAIDVMGDMGQCYGARRIYVACKEMFSSSRGCW